MAFSLPPLPYDYAALEPVIDTLTMQIHHGKHHAAYVNNLNATIAGKPLESKTLDEIITGVASLPDDIKVPVKNNVGGVWNHTFFWNIMAPKANGGGGEPTAKLADAIKSTFGTFADFKTKFQDAGVKRFGSGWAWLVVKDGKLAIGSTANQDSPVMGESVVAASGGIAGKPILALDVWEHAYYLKYQNRRPDYLAAWWEVVNWAKAAELFDAATK